MCKTLLERSIKGYIFGSACRHTLNTCLAPYHDISVCANFWRDCIFSGEGYLIQNPIKFEIYIRSTSHLYKNEFVEFISNFFKLVCIFSNMTLIKYQ